MIASVTIPVEGKQSRKIKDVTWIETHLYRCFLQVVARGTSDKCSGNNGQAESFFKKNLENYLTFRPLSYRESIPCCLLNSIDSAIHLIKYETLLICQQVTRRRENGGIPIYFQSSHHPTCTIQQIARMQLWYVTRPLQQTLTLNAYALGGERFVETFTTWTFKLRPFDMQDFDHVNNPFYALSR